MLLGIIFESAGGERVAGMMGRVEQGRAGNLLRWLCRTGIPAGGSGGVKWEDRSEHEFCDTLRQYQNLKHGRTQSV